MRYKIKFKKPDVILTVEDSFTLLDFMALFACLLLGVFFTVFLWIFAVALLIKLFTRHEYVFNSDTYQLTRFLRIFSYLRVKRRVIPFDEIDKFLFSNFNSGQALVERGLVSKEWFTLEIILTDKQRIRLVKLDAEDIEEVHELYAELKKLMNDWFHFEVEYEELAED
jgi:hypothetical protein